MNLEIYDTNGKNIYNKNFGELCEGLHNFNWNGKTEYGKSLPSGIYFIKIKTSDERKITKVILMK
ncbi:T9SS type A sorting domain-containing protein [bacterium]|nr:T9SS type A sorting domain-containing protein [bacterium]